MTDESCQVDDHLFAVECVDCVCRWMSLRSLDEVTKYWEQGLISTAALDGYRHVWAISAVRSKAYDHWMALPDTEEARKYASTLGAMLPSGRGYC